MNRPYKTLTRIFEDNNIQTDKLFFIDCVSLMVGGKPTRDENVLYISPTDLTDIAVAIDQWVEGIPEGKKMLFLDSISTLFLYNAVGTLERFSHFLTNKMRVWGLNGVFMSLEKENDPNFLNKISQFCDRTISLD